MDFRSEFESSYYLACFASRMCGDTNDLFNKIFHALHMYNGIVIYYLR